MYIYRNEETDAVITSPTKINADGWSLVEQPEEKPEEKPKKRGAKK